MFDLQREVSQPLIDELELIGNEQLVVSGHKLIKEGTMDGSIYVLKAGAFSVITSNALGVQHFLADLGPGSVKTPLVAGLFASFSIKRWSSLDEITSGWATERTRDAVDRAKRSKANGNVDNVFPEAAALHALQIVFVDGLSVKSLSGHEFEVS